MTTYQTALPQANLHLGYQDVKWQTANVNIPSNTPGANQQYVQIITHLGLPASNYTVAYPFWSNVGGALKINTGDAGIVGYVTDSNNVVVAPTLGTPSTPLNSLPTTTVCSIQANQLYYLYLVIAGTAYAEYTVMVNISISSTLTVPMYFLNGFIPSPPSGIEFSEDATTGVLTYSFSSYPITENVPIYLGTTGLGLSNGTLTMTASSGALDSGSFPFVVGSELVLNAIPSLTGFFTGSLVFTVTNVGNTVALPTVAIDNNYLGLTSPVMTSLTAKTLKKATNKDADMECNSADIIETMKKRKLNI